MLFIEDKTFVHNLALTQQYCTAQLNQKTMNNARVFRSNNPVIFNAPVISFEIEHQSFSDDPLPYEWPVTKWSVDPLDDPQQQYISWLFDIQLSKKEECIQTTSDPNNRGRIFISELGSTTIDGTSEVASNGLIDAFDLPPIDTWIYLTENRNPNLLFAWIPEEYVDLANDAILVNAVGCIYWFDQGHRKEYS